ncbi:hypothetical protein TB1_029631 [Malus domestica]
MCTVIKRIDPSLAYLEQIRQYVARLPSIDPNTRTVLICGYPNVGKSSFITRLLGLMWMSSPMLSPPNHSFVGHTDYKYLRYQPFDGISEDDKKLVAEMKNEAMKTVVGQGGEATNDEGVLLTMSTLIDKGVMSVENAACERLLNQRVELKMKSKKVNDYLNRFHVAMPKPCDNEERPLCIPQVVLEAKSKQAVEKEKRSTERNLENENGGAGVYSASLKKHYIANDEWKEDVMPEILDGHNVYDFVDPDILHRLEELEREERLRQEEEGDDDFEMDWI